MMFPPIYNRPQLWVGVLLMLVAVRLSYTALRRYGVDEWASLTDDEQARILWLRTSLGTMLIGLLWVASVAVLVHCDP
jgi:hypothetical protein